MRMFPSALRSFARWIGCGIVCAIAFVRPALALNPTYLISQYGHTSWKDNAGTQVVMRIKQTSDGYLWLATRVGLIRFDGVRFTTFSAGTEKGLESSTMQDLLIDPDGSMWVATLGGGLAHYQSGKFHTYTERDGLPSNDINSLFRDSHGTLWVGTRGAGIARMVNGKFEGFPVPIPPSRITGFVEGPSNSLWIATFGFGVFRLQNGTVKPFTVKDGLPDNHILTLYQDHTGKIWTAGWKGISSWDGRRFVPNTAVNTPALIATSCIEDRDRNLWIGSSTGLLRVRGTKVARMDRSMGLSGDFTRTVFEDREGNLWVGTIAGLDRLRDEQVQVFAQSGPIVSDAQGVWTVSDGQISHLAANTIRTWPVSLPKNTTVFTLSSWPDGGLLIGSDKGAWIWTARHIRSIPELSGLMVRSLLRARDGSIWIGTANRGLLHWTPSAGSRALAETGVPDTSIVTLAEDHTGAIWAGSESGGLYRVDRGNVQHFGRNQGLRSSVIYSVYVDHNDELWIGSAGGLSWLQHGEIHTVNSQQGMPGDQVFAILDDSFNRIWLSVHADIVAIDKKSLSEFASGVRNNLSPAVYPFPQGPEDRRNFRYFPSTASTADGHLWFGTVGGLCEVTLTDPAALRPSQFPVLVEDIIVDGSVRAEPGPVRITAGTRSVELRYTALTLSNSEAVEFRYRLEGFDSDWVQAGTRRLAFYNNLKPGTYRFRVDARIGGEEWRESQALVLEQLPFFYQTWWFMALASAAVLSLIIFVYRLRLRQAVNRIQAGFQQRVEERTRIARELHDTLLQSFQALMIQFQAARNMVPRKPEDAVHALDEAIAATAQAIAEGRDTISDLRPHPVEQRDLTELLNAVGRELGSAPNANGRSPSFRVVVEGKPQTISMPSLDEAYRIAREAIRNAFLHARASHIEVEVHYDKDQLRLRVRDDGRGIDPNIVAAGGRSGHWGIPGILERAKRIGSRLEFWSEEGAGTEVELVLPAAIAYEKGRNGHRFRLFRGAAKDGQRS